ncbi:hypothetical protein AXF42_Ash011424 [Apostasia shenzhenica]|uniref:Uncharacterized protein n=1 Tax=Apostasia shenzhenica TaxID=1088818 RepID=A0A2I0AEG4_9ASPA|nr:hypothetical protein AXF42_Ash011424 [Apostasia shenzhenica]
MIDDGRFRVCSIRASVHLALARPKKSKIEETKIVQFLFNVSGEDMGREDEEIRAAKLSYKEVARDRNHEEEAWWANVLGDLLKRRGEYVEALTGSIMRSCHETGLQTFPVLHFEKMMISGSSVGQDKCWRGFGFFRRLGCSTGGIRGGLQVTVIMKDV